MDFEINRKIVQKVLKHIAKNKKPVNYLVSTLNISCESAYRRLRGTIPFTVRELVTLSTDLDFSIDKLFYQEKQNKEIFDYTRIEDNSSDFFVIMLKKYGELIEKINNAKKVESIMAFNSFPPPFFINFTNLFKFVYYKWLHQDKEISRNTFYSEVILPDEAFILQRKMKKKTVQIKNSVLILDMNIFFNFIREIQYFYHRKSLTNDELLLLKEEMLRLIELFEELTQSGVLGCNKIQIYLSSLNISSNTVYYNYDDTIEPLFWTFTTNPVIIQSAGFISMQIKWLNFLKRQSELITQSNEIAQADFFYMQRRYIDEYLSVENTI